MSAQSSYGHRTAIVQSSHSRCVIIVHLIELSIVQRLKLLHLTTSNTGSRQYLNNGLVLEEQMVNMQGRKKEDRNQP
jgi:hypothetical protein